MTGRVLERVDSYQGSLPVGVNDSRKRSGQCGGVQKDNASPLDKQDHKLRSCVCVCTQMQKDHARAKGPVVHVKSLVDYGNAQITQHELKVWQVLKMLKVGTMSMKKNMRAMKPAPHCWKGKTLTVLKTMNITLWHKSRQVPADHAELPRGKDSKESLTVATNLKPFPFPF